MFAIKAVRVLSLAKVSLYKEGPIEMGAKKRKKNAGGLNYVLLTLLVTLVILVLLYYLYEQTRRAQKAFIEIPLSKKEPENLSEALLQLEKLRKEPDFALPINTGGRKNIQLVEHTFLRLGYSEEHEQAAWVVYLLSRRHALNTHERRNNFRSDPQVLSKSAHQKDYTRSGYDRGHLAPAADFDFQGKALNETFYMSNISPQKPAFNRGGWKKLEALSRQWASTEDSLWIVTGPVLGPGLKKIGQNHVSVPEYFYKIILDSRQPSIKIIGFLMPNRKLKHSPGYYAVPIDSIEKVSGLNFFPQMPDLLEEALEKNVQYEEWLSPEVK